MHRHRQTHIRTNALTHVYPTTPQKLANPIWLGDNKLNSQQHVFCAPEPGKPKECTSPHFTPALYLPLFSSSSACLPVSVFSCSTMRHWVKDPLLKWRAMCLTVRWHPSVCLCVCKGCQRNQSDGSVKSLPSGWREEKGREERGSGMEKGRECKDEIKRKINSCVKERSKKCYLRREGSCSLASIT